MAQNRYKEAEARAKKRRDQRSEMRVARMRISQQLFLMRTHGRMMEVWVGAVLACRVALTSRTGSRAGPSYHAASHAYVPMAKRLDQL